MLFSFNYLSFYRLYIYYALVRIALIESRLDGRMYQDTGLVCIMFTAFQNGRQMRKSPSIFKSSSIEWPWFMILVLRIMDGIINVVSLLRTAMHHIRTMTLFLNNYWLTVFSCAVFTNLSVTCTEINTNNWVISHYFQAKV